jgi:chemotaxis protein MotB
MASSRKAKGGGSDIPEWLVTFADLMSILVCFFVLIISFSIQDQQKLQIVAGSMKDAFGIVTVQERVGVIERDGNPQRDYLKDMAPDPTEASSNFSTIDHDQFEAQGPEANTHSFEPTDVEVPAQFSLAAASIRQAWQEDPEITQYSENLIVEETQEGLNIVIADQDGHPMFPEGSKYPYEVTRKAIAHLAPILQQLTNPIRITGHTAAGTTYLNPRYGKWELSADRANVVRSILEEFGLTADRIHSVAGVADTDPFFPNASYLAANQRIVIEVMQEPPPVPADLQP